MIERKTMNELEMLEEIIMRKLLLFLLVSLIISGCEDHQSLIKHNNEKQSTFSKQKYSRRDNMTVKIVMTINNKDFVISLKQNKATHALIKQLPLTMTMKDLNGNEKYHYIQKHLPTETEFIDKIEAGDFMLFGDNCLVLFYKSFSTQYSYTKLGRIEDVEGYLKVINQSSDINISLHQ